MGKRILVVDDESNIVQMLETRLKAKGFEVISAATGEEALSRVKKDHPDLVILDVMMPPPNGFQVCRTLKDDSDLKKIPIILLTAKSTESDKFWGLEAGADAYVTKPYNADDLLTKVRTLLEK